MAKGVFLFIFFFFLITFTFGQKRPFPQEVIYTNGIKATTLTSQDALIAYTKWKNLFLISCDNYYRVEAGSNQTLSEGMGYGMLLTAYFGEKAYFDGLLGFYKSKRTPTAHNLMGWKVTCPGFVDQNSATDGDLDVAFSLIVASYQWDGNYLDEAKNILSIIKANYTVSCNNLHVLYPGYGWGGCGLTDISYYTPGYFRVFAEVTGDSFWNEMANDTYTILENGANHETGLIPDWQSYDGIAGGSQGGGWTSYYRYDASRVPWRMSLDYLWNGNTTARDWCTKITTWANGIGASNIKDGYQLDGTVAGQYNNSAFVGGFAVGAMCNSQTIVNNFASRLKYLEGMGWDDTYFNLSLRCLYELTLTGNFWEPGLTNSADEIKSQPDFKLKYNENSGMLHLEGLKNVASVEVVCISGQIKLSANTVESGEVQLNISSLDTGIYLARVIWNDGTSQSVKFVKK
jgi:endo-1,4-beta-D-glucanase Y